MNAFVRQRGLTFVELIISIVVIGIAVSGVLLVMNTTVSKSADPMLQHQALAVAEAYLEEILTRDPGPPSGAAARADFATVGDYHGLSEAPRDQTGTALGGLSTYTVSVAVVENDGQLPNGIPSQRVDVQVTHPNGVELRLSGYKTAY